MGMFKGRFGKRAATSTYEEKVTAPSSGAASSDDLSAAKPQNADADAVHGKNEPALLQREQEVMEELKRETATHAEQNDGVEELPGWRLFVVVLALCLAVSAMSPPKHLVGS